MLNDREIASAIWIAVALSAGLWVPGIRRSLVGCVLAFIQPVLLAVDAVFAAWILVLVRAAATTPLWSSSLAKDTVIWFVLAVFTLLLNPDRTKPGKSFYRHALWSVIGLGAFLEFYANLMVFTLPVELVLQPTLVFVVLMRVTAGTKPEYRPARILFDGLSGVIGLLLLVVATGELLAGWNSLDKAEILRSLALPVWLTVGSFPLVYVVGAVTQYEWVLRQVSRKSRDRRAVVRVLIALVLVLRLSRDIERLVWPWPDRLASAASIRDALRMVARFKAREKAKRVVRRHADDRLKTYAGVAGTDSVGRQLDRREFRQTQDALELLSAYETGWYRQHGRRYGQGVLAVFNTFTHDGLPQENGIVVRVSPGGRAWLAWRRCVTGWCFAIGNAGPPGDCRYFDGPEPPASFPGSCPGWAQRPGESATNWG